ncbi:hypothetical protein D9619_007434 [Psilocybe cf. subviscida]|uniref:Telomere-associated protein Rif1 N-terminal domain-containing protein n=1 Tax=Psilocybe cf. subviscida TaxID=2480587 RepID=A0A8H5B1K6_9AGAR|nr:hypothetical protein D9619_007434 [Psilocybe cf. subviscida]
MSLLTPPRSSHRSDKEKENKFSSAPLAGPSTRSVVWAPQNSIHNLATPIKHVLFSSKNRPGQTKSILKTSNQPILISSEPSSTERETTPAPEDPLVDLNYLNRPVSQILAEECNTEEGIKELVEGYNDLATRLRASVDSKTDVDASWPLFQPLRKNQQAFIDALVRDVGRALTDPLSYGSEAEQEKRPRFSLPSPQKSPTKKKGGFSEEQIKFARDLCTISHAALKLLSVLLAYPALYNVFDHNQLQRLLTAVLAIPLADDLPTPNARKTCALVIWLIQVQRLPSEVLAPAATRISYSLRRGIDGELGKEGKKGSANDGLKAIHDLCEYMPSVFVPAFTPLLSSVLSNLLAPTLVLRTQACHALGGFALGSTQIPLSTVHTKISRTIADYLTTPTSSPSKAPAAAASPSKVTVTEAAIVRTLRTTMKNGDPQQAAQGPVWAVSVIANLVVLLGARICEDAKIARIVSGLMSLGLQHAKSSMRALVCVVWRPIAWAYFQPSLPAEESEEDGEEEVDADEDEDEEKKEMVASARAKYLKIVMSVVDCQAGVSSIAALMSDEAVAGDDSALKACIEILQSMALKSSTQTCQDAVETLRYMVNPQENADDVAAWNQKLLLPKKLFSANPGLLTADFKCLNSAVRPILEEVALINDVRCFTKEEMARPWVFRGVVVAWRAALGCMELADDTDVPEAMVEIWQQLLKSVVEFHQENEDEEALSAFACTAAKYVVHVLEDSTLNLMPNKDSVQNHLLSAVDASMPGSDDTVMDTPNNDNANVCSDSELRLRVVHKMWSVMREEFPVDSLRSSADQIMLAALMKNEAVLVYERTRTTGGVAFDDSRESARERNAWLGLVVDVLVASADAEKVKAFWECDEDSMALSAARHSGCWSKGYTRAVWRMCVQKWTELGGIWEGGVVLLGVPFTDKHYWNLTSEDFTFWEEFLSYTTGKSLDDSADDSSVVLDSVSSFVSAFQTPKANPSASLRLLDLLLTGLDAADMRDLPTNILELASQTLSATYPPEPKNKQPAIWMLRTLTSVVEKCPALFAQQLLATIQDGLCVWLADEYEMWTEDELTFEIVPLYTHILFKIQTMPHSAATLEAMGDIMASIFRHRTPLAAVQAFTDFWNLTYATIEAPIEGWSDSIRRCLVAVGILPYEEPEVVKTPESPLAPALVLQPSSPHTPTSSAPSCSSPSLFGSEFLDRVHSPKRPHKPFGGSYPTVLSTPPSPVQIRRTKANAQRTPLSPRNLNPPPKRRRLLASEDVHDEKNGKENDISASPATVLDRIAQMKSTKSNGKKRRLEDDDEEEDKNDKEYVPVPSAKKLRSRMKARPTPASKPRPVSPPRTVTCVSSDESDEERSVEESLTNSLNFPSVKEEEAEIISVTSRRTRSSLQSPSRSEPEPIASGSGLSTPMRRIDLSTVKLKRSVSNPEARFIEIVAQSSSTRLKRKRRESDDDHFEKLNSSDTPLPAPFVPAARTSRRVYSLPSSDDVPVPPLSSDDDPHTGQVTPHRLISPVPKTRRRAASALMLSKLKSNRTPTLDEELFGDEVPGSDDSVTITSGSDSDSPTKAVVSRQLRRLRSSDAVLSSKPARKLTVIDVLDLTV